MMFRILALLLLPVICLAQVNSNGEKPTGELLSNEISPNEMKRNVSFNLDEIKVRWKKAALENCTGVPCVITPPPPPPPSFTCGTSTISDIDNNPYETVLIGTQCWTKQNLKVSKYNDGTAIPLDNTGGADGNTVTGGLSVTWNNWTTGAYTIYGNQPSTGTNTANYGFLYNGFAAAGIITNFGSPTKNICLVGWHVPSEGEWRDLIDYLGGVNYAGNKIRSTDTTYWNSLDAGTNNSSGFSALPGGYRNYDTDPRFFAINTFASFWSTTQYPSSPNDAANFFVSDTGIGINYRDKKRGYSIRCIRD